MNAKTISVKQLRYHWEIYLFVLPTLALIGLFSYYPAASGIFHSFYRWNGADISEWVGFQNYLDLLRSAAFWDSFKIAFLLGFWAVVKMLPGIAVAVAIHRCSSERMQFLYRATFVIPMVIPGLVTVLIWRSFFFEATSGYLNWFLAKTHLMSALAALDGALGWGGIFAGGILPAWLGDPRLIISSCVMMGFPWVGGLAVLMHLAKLQNIPKAIYEAGEIDGTNWWTKFTKIELPWLTGSIYINLVFAIIDTVRDAGAILALVGFDGGPGGKATVPALFMLREAFVNQNMGNACAIGIVLTAVIMTMHKAGLLVADWKNLSPVRRILVRTAGIVLAIIPLAAGRLVPLASILLAASLPWPWALRKLKPVLPAGLRDRLFPPPSTVKLRARNADGSLREPVLPVRRTPPAAKAAAASNVVMSAAPAAPPALLHARGRSPRELALRSLKHGWILFVMGIALLPVYLMAIVFLKNNQQFYMAPARLTTPYHWENLHAAWVAVGASLANSFFICMSATLIAVGVALSAAYFFARVRVPLTGLFWNAILVLMMLPSIANLIPLFRLLADLDLLNTLTALIVVLAAGGQVGAIFILRNFVADIPQDMFDAAEVDGASHFQQIRTIVVPQAGAILGTVGVMQLIGTWNEFVLPLIIMRDHDRLPVTVQLLRMSGEYIKYWGPLMAGYAMASFPIVVIFILSMRLFMKGMTEGGVQ